MDSNPRAKYLESLATVLFVASWILGFLQFLLLAEIFGSATFLLLIYVTYLNWKEPIQKFRAKRKNRQDAKSAGNGRTGI
ncbi:MAG TPA: hypothetical protein VHP31_03260 [Caproicibacter sp.]|nr:hypothetical protein [Caproicibacter sp.]